MDLAPIERQRLASQLVVSVESAAVLLAGALSQTHHAHLASGGAGAPEAAAPAESRDAEAAAADSSLAYLRVTESAYVSIKSLGLVGETDLDDDDEGVAPKLRAANRSFELVFPSARALLGTKWAPAEPTGSREAATLGQRFVLRLSASSTATTSGQSAPELAAVAGKTPSAVVGKSSFESQVNAKPARARKGLTKLKTETFCHL